MTETTDSRLSRRGGCDILSANPNALDLAGSRTLDSNLTPPLSTIITALHIRVTRVYLRIPEASAWTTYRVVTR